MKIISHRGNIRGAIPDQENRPSYIDCAMGSGYDVEIDLRVVDGELWLGHDEPQYKVEHPWLETRREFLWIHCKDLEAAKQCWVYQSFCHHGDPYTYTSTGKIWLHETHIGVPEMKIDDNIIIPMIDDKDYPPFEGKPYAICTDYPSQIK